MIKPIKHIHDSGAYKYADLVLSEKVLVGELMKDACKRFLEDLKRDDLFFDLEVARKVVNYPKLLKHWKGAKVGLPIDLELHQQFYFQQMFGWKELKRI